MHKGAHGPCLVAPTGPFLKILLLGMVGRTFSLGVALGIEGGKSRGYDGADGLDRCVVEGVSVLLGKEMDAGIALVKVGEVECCQHDGFFRSVVGVITAHLLGVF